MPQVLALSDQSHQVLYRRLSDATPERKIAAATHKRRRQSFLAQHFIEMVQEEYPVQ